MQAISRPMMPPPTTSSCFGMSASISASVESITRASSQGKPASFTGWEPAAMMHCSKRMSWVPAVPLTSSSLADTKRPVPVTVRTLRCFAMLDRPLTIWPTTLSLWPRSLSRSILGAPKLMPKSTACLASTSTSAACSRALDGMQPTLRQTPPSAS